jgi:hypothetical protein
MIVLLWWKEGLLQGRPANIGFSAFSVKNLYALDNASIIVKQGWRMKKKKKTTNVNSDVGRLQKITCRVEEVLYLKTSDAIFSYT